MLHIYNTKGVDYALGLGAPVDCLVVDACGTVADADADTNNGDDGVEGALNNNDTGGGVPNDVLVGQKYPYYPDITSGKCYNDGRQSEFQVHLYDTLSDCVSFHSIIIFFFFAAFSFSFFLLRLFDSFVVMHVRSCLFMLMLGNVLIEQALELIKRMYVLCLATDSHLHNLPVYLLLKKNSAIIHGWIGQYACLAYRHHRHRHYQRQYQHLLRYLHQ